MLSSRVSNIGGYDTFWYIKISPGDRCLMESFLVGAEGYDRVSVPDSDFGSLVGFSLGGPGSELGSEEGGLFSDSCGSSSSLLKSSG